MRLYSPLLLITPFALAACGIESPVSPTASRTAVFAVGASSSSAQAGVTTPFRLEFDDFNPCTGVLEHFVFEGTQRLQSVGDHFVLHISGTVTTSDGWVGKFNRQLVNQGGVLTWRFLDWEVGPAHARQIFNGILHGTLVDGEIVWTVQKASLRCIGKPSTE